MSGFGVKQTCGTSPHDVQKYPDSEGDRWRDDRAPRFHQHGRLFADLPDGLVTKTAAERKWIVPRSFSSHPKQ